MQDNLTKKHKSNLWLVENLFIRALLVIALGVVAAGVAGIYLVQARIESKVRDEAVRDAAHMISPQVLKIFSGQDLTQLVTGREYEELDQVARDYMLDPHVGHVERIKIWNTGGTVVYSSLASQVGETHPENEQFVKALEGKRFGSWPTRPRTRLMPN